LGELLPEFEAPDPSYAAFCRRCRINRSDFRGFLSGMWAALRGGRGEHQTSGFCSWHSHDAVIEPWNLVQ